MKQLKGRGKSLIPFPVKGYILAVKDPDNLLVIVEIG